MNKKIEMNHKVDFKLLDTESMEWVSEDLPIDQVYTCRDLDIYWHDDTFNLLIGIESAGDVLFFVKKLSDAMAGNLRLHSSIQPGLGYIWNEIFQEKSGFFYEPSEDGKDCHWVGSNYHLWGTHGKDVNPHVTTWLYNDEQGNIILEVTEMYRWSSLEYDSADAIPFVSYEDFIKNYKPIFKKIIPKHVAQRWLLQAQQLYEVFYENEQKCKD